MPADILPPTDAAMYRAVATLSRGGLVGLPTETVYGLAAKGSDPAAVARIYGAKGRPRFNPLIAHVSGLKMARGEGVFSADAEQLAAAFWPGPLTLVVPAAPGATVCLLARAGLDTIALRQPS
ncbi:MAG: L-threonylcarbamoyladenylate synthase, partial [Pseudomonadota bacterium]